MTSWPVYLVAFLLVGPLPWLAFLLPWWLRPLLDRLPLFVISRSFFGDPPSRGQVLAHWLAWWSPGAFADLTWRRLDPQRSYLTPILMLEGDSSRLDERRRAFQRDSGVSTSLTLISTAAELMVVLAICALIEMLVPTSFLFDELAAEETVWSPFYSAFLLAVSFCAFLLIEPFYVGAGFALYLQRRIQSEGWDIELAFRRLSQRLYQAQPGANLGLSTKPRGTERRLGKSPAPILFLLWVVASAMGASLAEAELLAPPNQAEMTPTASSDEEIDQALKAVLADPVFGSKKQEYRWRFRKLWDIDLPEPPPPSSFPSPPSLILPGLLRWVVAALVVGALLYLLWRAWTSIESLPDAAPDAELGAPVVSPWLQALVAEPLPPDIVAAALTLARAGKLEQALGLLYRGALASLVAQGRLPERPDFTEGECVDYLRRHKMASLAKALDQLVLTWQRAVFGHRSIELRVIEELGEVYRRHFSIVAEPGSER